MKALHFIALLFVLTISGCAHDISTSSHPAISVILKPQMENGEVAKLYVTQTFTGYAGMSGEALFTVPSRIASTPGQNYQDQDVRAYDTLGALNLSLSAVSAPPGHPLEIQAFIPDRNTRGPVTLEYIASIAPSMAPRTPGPSYDLRGIDGGFGGAFFSFLLLPATAQEETRFSIGWDFSSFPENSSAATTLDTDIQPLILNPAEIYPTFFLGGNVQGQARKDSKFQMFWIGEPPFDPYAAADWMAVTFDQLEAFFDDQTAGNYTLLMRPFALPRDGGGATRGGFMLEYGTGYLSDAARRIMFTHEMIHHFLRGLEGNSSTLAWYGEGLAEFYKIKLTLNSNLISAQDAATEIGVMTDAYYSSSFVTTPYNLAAEQRWADRAAQSVPYNRGFMYFADLNWQIVRASGGERSLDDLIGAMLTRQRDGLSYDEAAWRSLLEAELGAHGLAHFDSMLQGKLIEPAEGSFGTCFTRTRIETHRPVLGFEENSVLIEPRIVSGLKPDSPAAQSGLQDGDQIIAFTGIAERIAHSAPNVRLAPEVSLTVLRDGKSHEVSFQTAGPEITAYSWNLRSGDNRGCALP